MIKLQLRKKFSKKRLAAILSCVSAMAISVSAVIGLSVHPTMADDDSTRVQMYELFGRYPIDYVVGPIDVKDTNGDGEITRADLNTNGKFTYLDDGKHCVMDAQGNHVMGVVDGQGNGDIISKLAGHEGHKLTNNTYGIPAEQYFDVENYIYTTGTKGNRTMYGWKPDIRACGTALAENGEILDGGFLTSSASPIGMHVEYQKTDTGTTQMFGTKIRYAIIAPSDIVSVGAGSGAYVFGNNAYYHASTGTTPTSYAKTHATYGAAFTDFACFITNSGIGIEGGEYFWQPRERLVGLYFPEDSKLQTILAGTDSGAGERAGNRTTIDDINKSAFQGCDNMRFLILPGANSAKGAPGVKSIGNYTFYRCTQLLDVNIPKSAIGTTVNGATLPGVGVSAFDGCSAILHLTLDSALQGHIGTNAFANCAKLTHVENGTNYSVSSLNGDVYVFGGETPTGEVDCGRYGIIFAHYNGSDSWTALSLAGATGENEKVIYVFPDSDEFNNNANNPRRSGVRYDYLDSEGNKKFTAFPTNTSNITYDIAKEFAKDTWCQNAIIPAACTKIGDSAFYNSHMSYLETYATDIGSQALQTMSTNTQWYYFHAKITKLGDRALSGFKGQLVFENYALYQSYKNSKPSGFPDDTGDNSDQSTINNSRYRYLIPIVANIKNEDKDAITFDYGDMDDRFFMDSDYAAYVKARTVAGKATASTAVTYTKRLSNSEFNYVKQSNGTWATANAVTGTSSNIGVGTHANPTLPNMDNTVWYGNASYTNGATNALSQYSSKATSSVNIYTKYVARPENVYDGTYDNVNKGSYTFGNTYRYGGADYKLGDSDTETISYFDALGLNNNDYDISLSRFTYASGNATENNLTALHHAGTYNLTISLNSKWGTWSSSYVNRNSDYFTAKVVIDRKVLDYSDITAIQFENTTSTSADKTLLGSGVNGTRLYHYNDGWYLTLKAPTDDPEYVDVINSFVYYTGEDITIGIAGENKVSGADMLGDTVIASRNGVTFSAATSYYDADFNFRVKTIAGTTQSNYIFNYAKKGEEGNNFDNVEDSLRGMRMTSKQDGSFMLRKRWYIVIKTNMFTSEAGTSKPYSPVTGTNIHYGDTITVSDPLLNYGETKGNIDFELSFVPADSASGTAVKIADRRELNLTEAGSGTPVAENTLAYYINTSMPAGDYTLTLHGKAVTVQEDGKDVAYLAITSEFHVIILPQVFDADTVREIGAKLAVKNEYAISTEEGTLPVRDRQIHQSISEQMQSLTDSLPTARTGFWAVGTQDIDPTDFFDEEVIIRYNRDGSGNDNYYIESETLGALATSGKYTFYYSISAKNYVAIGGADAANRKSYTFSTTLYTELSLEKLIYDQIVSMSFPYFKDVHYTGEEVHTVVPTSRYYESSFDDDDYINAREKATVTLTLYDPILVRWDETLPEGANKYFKTYTDDEGNVTIIKDGVLVVYFNILPAVNSWTVAPTMPPWQYFGFDRTVNLITSSLTFSGVETYYRLGTVATGGGWIQVYQPSDAEYAYGNGNGTYFAVDGNGQVPEKVEEIFKKLTVGTYYLGSYVSERTDKNVSGFEQTSGFTAVYVWQTANSWTTTPGMTGWKYNGFNTSNFRAGVAKFGEMGDVEYALYKKVNSSYETMNVTFKYDSATVLPSATVETLNGLSVGDYQIKVSLAGDGKNYGALDYTIDFSVAQAKNGWESAPQLDGWVYSGTFDESLFTLGEATFGSDEAIYAVQFIESNDTSERIISGDAGYVEGQKALTLTELKALLARLNASDSSYSNGTYGKNGRYNLIVTVPETENYASVSQNIRFTVSKAEQAWDGNQPSIEGWVYDGESYNSPTKAKVKNDTNTSPVVYEYFPATFVNGAWVKDGDAVTDLATASAGNYIMKVTVPGNDNYKVLEVIVPFTISKRTNEWVSADKTPEDRLDWTWGITEQEMLGYGLTNATAREMDEGLVYTIVRTDVTPNTTVTEKVAYGASREELAKVLTELKAGMYRITVTVAATVNCSELTKDTSVTVSKARFIWDEGHKPSDVSWTWNDGDIEEKIITPSAHTAKNNVVALVFELSKEGTGSSTTYRDFGLLKAELLKATAGTYTITITADEGTNEGYTLDNYEEFELVYTVTVSEIQNAWQGTYRTDYECEYGSAPAIADFKARIGDVRYYSDEATVTFNGDYNALIAFIKTLRSRDTAYVFYAEVAASEGKYTGLKATINVTVTGIKSEWKNKDELKALYEGGDFVYSDSLGNASESILNDVVIPYVEGTSGKVSYTVSYVNFEGKNPASFTVDNQLGNASPWESVTAWLIQQGKAGTYTIVAQYVPNDESYTSLVYTVTVNVARAKLGWGVTLDASYSGDYGSISVAHPALDESRYHNATVNISVKTSVADDELYTGGNLTDFVKTLDVLTVSNAYYIVTYWVDGTENYEPLEVQTSWLYISRIVNEWKQAQDVDGDTTITSSDWNAGYTWTYYRRETVKVVVPEALFGNEKFTITLDGVPLGYTNTADFNDYLATANLKEGTHTLLYAVDTDSVNYNGLTSTCSIIIKKLENSWKVEYSDENISAVGKVDVESFKYAEATNRNELVRFYVSKVGESKTDGPYDKEQLKEELAKLRNGSYTVTARLGGLNLDEWTNEFDHYNDDYESLEATTCTLTISLNPNDWSTGLEQGVTWEWGDHAKLNELAGKMPSATYGNDTVVYSIKDSTGKTIRTFDAADPDYDATDDPEFDSNAEKVYAALIEYLKTLDVGTYTMTVTIAATDDYASPERLSEMFTITQISSKWENGSDNITLSDSWDYGKGTEKITDLLENGEPQIHSDIVKGTWGAKTYSATGLVQQESSWTWSNIMSALTTANAGTYTITVSIEGDVNHTALSYTLTVNVLQVNSKWKDGTDNGQSYTWDYGKGESTIATLTEPEIHSSIVTGTWGTKKYAVNSETCADWNAIIAKLTAAEAGEYVVTVIIEEDVNHTALEYSITVNVLQINSTWSDGTASITLTDSWYYGKGTEKINALLDSQPEINFDIVKGTWGKYVYAIGGQPASDWATMIGTLKNANAGTYVFTITVAGDTSHTALDYTLTITVLQVTSRWEDDSDNGATYGWKYNQGGDTVDELKEKEPKIDDDIVLGTWGTAKRYTVGSQPYDDWASMIESLRTRTVGVYTVSVSITGDVNHTALSYSFTVTVSLAENEWRSGNDESGNEYITPNDDGTDVSITWVYGEKNNRLIVFEAVYNSGSIKITVNNSPVSSTTLLNHLGNLNANPEPYVIVARVPSDNERYADLTLTILLTIKKPANGWDTGDEENSYPLPDDSFKVGEDSGVKEWEWNSEVDWLGVNPKYGKSMVVAIAYRNGATLRTFGTDLSKQGDLDAMRGRLSEYLSALPAGEYSMTITVQAGDNWDELESSVVNFTVRMAENYWKENSEPTFKGADKNAEDGSYSWTYGTKVTDFAESRYGVYEIKYYEAVISASARAARKVSLGKLLEGMPTDAGTYVAVFTVAGTDNYKGIEQIADQILFTIEKADGAKLGYNKAPGISGWTWNGYNISANLFSGAPKSGGETWYYVLNSEMQKVKDSKGQVIKFQLVDALGNATGDYNADIFVKEEVAAELNKLPQGTYYLSVDVAETTNYTAFTDNSVSFRIELAANNWTQIPQIMTWSKGSWNESNTPVAEAVYGDVHIVITSNVGNVVFYDVIYKFNEASLYDQSADKYTVEAIVDYTMLRTADVGMYTMTTSVSGADGKYVGLATQTVRFEVYIVGNEKEQNYWREAPSIKDWVAEIGYYNVPAGLPARGLPYFVFYEAIKNAEGEWVKGEKVDMHYDGAELVHDPLSYAEDFYIPSKPGTYWIYGMAINYAIADGEDDLDIDSAQGWRFEISYRKIEWEETVTISSILYLGEKDTWTPPTSFTSLDEDLEYDCIYEYFKDDGSGESVGFEIPTEVGRYYVIATASARFTDKITSRAYFRVELSTNHWLFGSSPSIESWSEEDSEIPDPEGWVFKGEIVYTYVNKARPDVVLYEKPTAAGNYIMYATVEVEGYETLTAQYEFSIEPAFDPTLLAIDIVLATFACIITVVVIFFAIRRYRENG